MNLFEAQRMARELMRVHGLEGWRFEFDHARRRFGSCRCGSKLITLSRALTFLNDESQVRDTILHEIAHALTPGDGHGAKWRAKCRAIGANPKRCYEADEVVSPKRAPARYQLGCGRCGWWVDRRRRDRDRRLVCKVCRTEVTWRERAG